MTSRDLTFGVFVPQGWKIELPSIADSQAKWAKAIEVAQLAEELGFDSRATTVDPSSVRARDPGLPRLRRGARRRGTLVMETQLVCRVLVERGQSRSDTQQG
jgi:hypothetical protein